MRRLVLLSLLFACSSEPGGPLLQIDVVTDYVPREDFDAIRVQVGVGDLRTNLEHIVDPSGDYRRGRRIGSATGVIGDNFLTGELVRDGTVVGRAETIAVVRGDITVVTIRIDRACEGVMCPFPGGNTALRSCYGGLCADPRCTRESPEFCPTTCDQNDDCAQSGCRSAYCDLGACLSVPDDASCSMGERCRSDGVCVPATPDGGGPDGGVDADCVIGERVCAGNTLRECTESGIAETVCEVGCGGGRGAQGCLELVPSNLRRPLSDAAGAVSVISGGTWDTDQCEDIEGYWYVDVTPNEIELCVLAFEHLTFSGELRVVGSRGLAVVSLSDIVVDGAIRADGEGPAAGPGGGSGAATDPITTRLLSGQNGGSMLVFDDGGGGGGNGFGVGGPGGQGGTSPGGAPGTPHVATYALVPLRGGGAGGAGGGGESAGRGGGGGGAVQLSARGDIVVRQIITVGGGGGSGGGDSTTGDFNIGAGGGGGGGGSLLLEAAGNVHLESPLLIVAGGGGGGGAAGCQTYGPGSAGREDGSLAGGARGPSCPNGTNFGSRGGSGSGNAGGSPGEDNLMTRSNGGGGGGGGGLVVFRSSTTSGSLTGSGHRVSDAPTLVPAE